MTVVVLTDAEFQDVDIEQGRLAAEGIDLVRAPSPEPADVAGVAPGAEGLLVQWARIDSAMLDRLPQIRAIGRFGTGVDCIDVDEATKRGIAVVNSGHYATEDVAAHTVALVLALVRRLPQAAASVQAGRWDALVVAKGVRRLSETTIGVVGLGHIGRLVAQHLCALGTSVVAHDAIATAAPPGVRLAASLDELLRASDVVTLHVPLLPATANLLNRETLAQLPRGAMVVNTSRGGIVDEAALADALDAGHLSGAALDVFAEEPLRADNRLREFDNVLITPHMAFYSDGSMLDARTRTVESLIAALHGRAVPNLVNPGSMSRRSGSNAR
jgi:D-3-phosphoglycerate dehydrogenase / 2-oxoglutarate reductase